MKIKPATDKHFTDILSLNEASVHFLSPLTPARLQHLHAESAYHRVIEQNGTVTAFLLAFREGADYDSPNYLWFSKQYDRFLYIDRIVVSAEHRGEGQGRRLYEDIIHFAGQTDAKILTCEFDIEPPNEASRQFHARLGFSEVGSQGLYGGKKRVSLQARPISR